MKTNITTTSSTTSTVVTTTSKTKGITLTNGTTISNCEFKRRSYDAYIQYVEFMEGKTDPKTAFKKLSSFFADFGFELTVTSLANTLTISMATYGTMQGEKTRKVKSIATFRKFVLGDWKTVAESKFDSKPGKAPAPLKGKKTTKKPDTKKTTTKKPTKADLEAEIARLKAALNNKVEG